MHPVLKAVRSIVVFLLFLEMFFWAGGFVTRTAQSYFNALHASAKDVYRIMCIGESTTLLGGKDSYPSQLEVILNNGRPGKFQVINQGMAGVTTDTILAHLPQWINEYQPDMVVAMIGIEDEVQARDNVRLGFLKKIKIVRAFLSLKDHVQGILHEDLGRIRAVLKGEAPATNAPAKPQGPVFETDIERFENALARLPQEQRDLYGVVVLAEGNKRDDVAEVLYEKILSETKDPDLFRWMFKKYGTLLLRLQKYEKYILVMENIPSNAWTMEWVKGYCHSEPAMELVRVVIERMVGNGKSKQLYAWLASCYEEGGRKDLMELYLKKSFVTESSYYSAHTRANYIYLKDLLLAKGIQPVFVQYPMRDVRSLLSIFEDAADRDKIIFVDNGPSFQKSVSEKSYNEYFIDRVSGDHGHGTALGNHLLAENVAKAIAGVIPRSSQ